MKCFFHRSDLDGICSGAITRRKYPNCKMIDFDYGENYPFNTLDPKELTIIVDLCLPQHVMIDFVKNDAKVVWIDHHHYAIEDSVQHGYDKIRGLRKSGVGACELAWQYFFEAPIPESVLLLSQYDVWNHANRNVIPFQYGAASLGLSVYSNVWKKIFDDSMINYLVQLGLPISKYVKNSASAMLKRTVYHGIFEGYNTIFINSCILDSVFYTHLSSADLFNTDIIISYYRNPNREYYVSLRSHKDTADVGAIAVKHGGGGHKAAAGFICHELPF